MHLVGVEVVAGRRQVARDVAVREVGSAARDRAIMEDVTDDGGEHAPRVARAAERDGADRRQKETRLELGVTGVVLLVDESRVVLLVPTFDPLPPEGVFQALRWFVLVGVVETVLVASAVFSEYPPAPRTRTATIGARRNYFRHERRVPEVLDVDAALEKQFQVLQLVKPHRQLE